VAELLAQLFFSWYSGALLHIFREGNSCADKLVSHGHVVTDFVWWDIMPDFVRGDFFRDLVGLPNFCFP